MRGIRALVAKDFTLFFRNRFFAIVTSLALVVYVALYFVMPGSVDETMDDWRVRAGLVAHSGGDPATGSGDSCGRSPRMTLKDGVAAHDYVYGIVLPADMAAKLASGQKPQIDLYLASDTPEESKEAVSSLMSEMIYAQIRPTAGRGVLHSGAARPGHGGKADPTPGPHAPPVRRLVDRLRDLMAWPP